MGELETKACIACQIALPDKSVSPHSEMCPMCRERYIKYPFHKWLLIVLAVVVAVNVACYLGFPQTMRDFAALKKADNLFEQKHYLLAARAYADLSGKYAGSDRAAEKLVDAWMAQGSLSDANDAINAHFDGKNVSDELYNKLTSYSDTMAQYGKNWEVLEGVWKEGMSDEALLAEVDKLLATDAGNPVFLLQAAAINSGLGRHDKAIEQARQAVEKGDRYLYAGSLLGQALRRAGRFDEARQACQAALALNQDDVDAHRQLAVLGILTGDYASAVAEARAAYDLDKTYPYVGETLVIACHISGDGAGRDATLAELRQAGVEMDGEFQKLIDGQLTAEDIYLK